MQEGAEGRTHMKPGRPADEQPEADLADALEQASPPAGLATSVEAGDQPAEALEAPEADEADVLEQATPPAGPAASVEAGDQPAVPLEAPEADALEQQSQP
jgi:hypothetical protein